MQKKKPDIFLGITVGMLVLAAVLCLVILFAQKSAPAKNDANNNGDPAAPVVSDEVIESGDATKPSDSDHQTPSDQETTDPDNPNVPVDVKAIDDVSLKAALDDCLSGLPNDWQVVVMDPIVGTEVDSYINCKGVNDLMKADQMLPVFIMATAFQKVADGALTEDQILDDVKAMIVQGDRAAADRLTEAVGGKEAVKKFAEKDFGTIGYNKTMSGVGSKPNYVTGQQMAKILNMICRGELVSKDASSRMLDILCEKRDSEEIDLGITDESIKYGFVSYAEDKVCVATMGVVRLPHRSFVISVICNGPNTLSRAKDKVTQLVTLTLPYFND